MSRTITIETFQEFDARHGKGLGLRCGATGFILWPDGAGVLADDADQRAEPSDDPKERLRMRRLHFREALRRAEQDFASMQQHFAEQAALCSRYSNLPAPPADAPQILERLAEQVRKHRDTLAEIESKLVEAPTGEALRIQQYQERLAQEQVSARDLLKEIQAVTI